jgi:TM2 domain-containing membrane protein YozV
MDMFNNAYMALPGITPEEVGFLQQAVTGLDENQQKSFFAIYSGKRKSTQDVLIFCLVGMFLVPGLQRFILGQIGMGLAYLFTLGFCFIGSLIDLINHKTLALDYNKKMAYESFQLVKMSGGSFL